MKLLAILLITWIDGSQSGFALPPDYECGDAMNDAIALAKANDMAYTMMQCLYTDTIIVSPRPLPRPEGL
jgi:hypothetical protein